MSLVDHQSASPSDCARRTRVCFLTGAAVASTGALPIPFPAALDGVGRNPFLKVRLRAGGPLFLERLVRVPFLRNPL